MRPSVYSEDDLAAFLRRRRIATMPELRAALGTTSERTVFRKLAALPYRSSYSHRGAYYALDEVMRFDDHGLWSFMSAWFSVHGNLLSTVLALVDGSEAGHFARELDAILHVPAKDALRALVRRGLLVSEEGPRLLFCSADPVARARQLSARRAVSVVRTSAAEVRPASSNELDAALQAFMGILDERQRRLFGGLESLRLGRGRDQEAAERLGLNAKTVARGRRELLHGDLSPGPIRRPGGGRRPSLREGT
jgi:hypothetical protein